MKSEIVICSFSAGMTIDISGPGTSSFGISSCESWLISRVRVEPSRACVFQHRKHGVTQRLRGIARTCPALTANPVCIQPDNWNVALPTSVTAGKFKLHVFWFEADAFHCKTGDFTYCNVIT